MRGGEMDGNLWLQNVVFPSLDVLPGCWVLPLSVGVGGGGGASSAVGYSAPLFLISFDVLIFLAAFVKLRRKLNPLVVSSADLSVVFAPFTRASSLVP